MIMKKTLLFVAALALSLGMSAQTVLDFEGGLQMRNASEQVQGASKAAPRKAEIAANQRLVGYYYNDELVADNASMGLPGTVAEPDCKAAMHVTADMLKPYVGMKVVGIRFGLACIIDKSRVFMAPVENNVLQEDMISKEVPSTAKGWNTVLFDEPYTIEANKEFFVGFDFTQKTTNDGQYYLNECFPLSYAPTRLSGSSFLVYCNIPKSKKGNGWGWYNFSAYGAVSVQLIVEGDFPEYAVEPLEFLHFVTKPNTAADFDVECFNNSKEAISSLSYVVSIDGVAAEEKEAALTSSIGRGSYGVFNATFPGSAVAGQHKLDVTITKVNGNANLAAGKTFTGKMGVADSFYPRNVLIEEFTSENCGNCPRVIGYLKTALNTADDSRVTVVCHHAGYGEDWLTRKWDTDITSMMYGNTGSTFAPAVGFNRDYSNISEQKSKGGVLFLPGSSSILKAKINKVIGQEANTKLDIEVVKCFDGTWATVTVNGECNTGYNQDNSNFTFYLTENQVKAKKQAGASGTFYHDHVIRYNNSSWGEAVEWKDNKFTKTFTVNLDSNWKTDDLTFVALLNGHNESNYKDNTVDNVAFMTYGAATTGINGVADNGETMEVARYSLDGVKLSAPQKGLNIVKLSDGRTMKVMVK